MRKLFFAVLIFASACSIEERGAPGTNPNTEIDIGGQTSTDSVTVTIAAPRAAAVGDRIPISLVVQNNRDRGIELHLTGREPTFDIIVARSDSTIVWRRLASVSVMQILLLKPMAPAESFTVYDYWQPTEAGEYVIGAELPTDARPLQARPTSIVIR
jgi:hypothetical protein